MQPSPELRRWFRQEYLRQHAADRRAADKAAGAKRIDVTLRGDAIADYERVKGWLDENNRMMIERRVYNTPRTLPDGTTFTISPTTLSATEIIQVALGLAASKIEDENRGR